MNLNKQTAYKFCPWSEDEQKDQYTQGFRDNAMVLKWIILVLLDIDFVANNVLSKTENVIQLSH